MDQSAASAAARMVRWCSKGRRLGHMQQLVVSPKSTKRKHIASVMLVSASVFVVGVTLAENDRFALNAPNGIAFSEFKDYETWDVIGSSVTDDAGGCGTSPEPGCIKSIVGNPVMIGAFKAGIPANGQSVRTAR